MATPPSFQHRAGGIIDTHDQSAAVNHTISADRAGGHAAHAELGLAQLAASSSPIQGNHALMEYQIQVMLLEQQNKKRFMQTEQEKASQECDLGVAVHNFLLDYQQQLEALEDQENERGLMMDLQQHDPEHSPLPVPENRTDSERLEPGELQGAAPVAQDEAGIIAANAPRKGPGYVVLYRVRCLARYHRCDGRLYTKLPGSTTLGDNHPHLARGDHISSISVISTAFSVVRTVTCDQTGVADSSESQVQGYQPSPQTPIPFRRARPLPPVTRPTHFKATPQSTHYFLYHHREALRHAAAENPCDQELANLCAYLQQHPDPMYVACDKLLELGRVSAETLPWLFRPNEVIVAKDGSVQIACMLKFPPRACAFHVLELLCWYWGYDGTALRRKDREVELMAPSYDTIAITELSAYPLRYATDETKQRLLERGSRFWALRNPCHVSYEGPDYKGERVYPWDSRCMIDYKTYHMFHHGSEAFNFLPPVFIPFDKRPQRIDITTTTELSETDIMLLPPGIHGFFLKEKKWVHLHINNISPVTWNKEAFDRLVLPPRIKNMVRALVLVRKRKDAEPVEALKPKLKRSDLVRGKGGGLIMLLHGGPGTRKTLTAELAEMPLYSVTCGDVGTRPEAVKNYLNSVLHLGQKWNCVLLLDEADVFLEQRSLSDLNRNSLLSVFLRTLEYYSGILILTSNRVGTFDAAFKSRIQVALHYPPLDRPSRRAIWANFLDMLHDDAEESNTNSNSVLDYDGIATHLDDLAAREMNGRQIRNAMSTAGQLALFEGVPIRWEHVEVAMGAAADFDSHLRRVGALGEEDGWVIDGASVLEGGASVKDGSSV
ncbi:Fidgetin-like protein 1 [Corynascus novoguineensis]|uniref:Fidgetin-like protein 1 n=1 Tax=Corynascus novoguineensis TaxID=1126955 RepID=A0AAN7CNQ0_9PEZI|nr:Fidgetin-like protein 1 [Corynascus novoguineensis]